MTAAGLRDRLFEALDGFRSGKIDRKKAITEASMAGRVTANVRMQLLHVSKEAQLGENDAAKSVLTDLRPYHGA